MKLSITEFYLSENPKSTMCILLFNYGTPEHRNKYLGTIFLFQKEEENNNILQLIELKKRGSLIK